MPTPIAKVNTMSDDNAGWLKMVLSWDWHAIALRGYPGWEMDGNAPPFVMFTVRNGVDMSSRDLAIAFDDLSEGRFYYRDWTDSSLPFVSDGEAYRSGFWFQRASDRDAFVRLRDTMQAARRRDHVLACYEATAALA